MTYRELLEQRNKAIADARSMIDRAEKESRDVTAEEQDQINGHLERASKIDGQIEVKKRVDAAEEVGARYEQRDAPRVPERTPEDISRRDDSGQTGTASPEYRDAFWRYIRRGQSGLYPEQRDALRAEVREHSLTDAEGGYTVPDEFIPELVGALRDANVMRQICRVLPTTSGTTEIPVISTRGVAAWTAEKAAYTEKSDTFGQVTLGAHKAGAIMKITEELLNDSAFSLSAYVATEIGAAIGDLEEAAFVNGDGSAKPTGIVGSAAHTLATQAAVTADGLIALYHELRRPYRMRAAWMMSDAVLLTIRQLKDTTNQYIWQPGLQAGEPDRILGKPVYVSENMPAATTGLKPVIFGDFGYYWIAQRQSFGVQRLDELYAANGYVGFRAFERVDGKLTLAEAVQAYEIT